MTLEKMKERLIDDGIAQVGFADVSGALDEQYKDYPYAISMVFRLSDAVIDGIDGAPTYTYFQHYRAVNAFLDGRALWVCEMLRRMGHRAIPVAASQSVHDMADEYTGIFQHKTAARLAGLGTIGKNAMFVSYEHGPRIRLATVLTDMSLPVNTEFNDSVCGSCSKCVENCPAGAISGENYAEGKERIELLDAKKCSEHMKKAYKHIGRGAVCGICMKVCPLGRKEDNVNVKAL